MEIKNALQRFEELERQADAELGAIEAMDAKMTAFYAEEVLGTTAPDVVVRQIARSVENTYIALGAVVPPHVSAASGRLKPGALVRSDGDLETLRSAGLNPIPKRGMSKLVWSGFGLAAVFASLSVVAVYQLISSRRTVNAKAPAVQVLVAGRNMEIGSLIKDSDFKMVEWPGALPAGSIVKKEDAVGRGVITSIYEGEPILESRLASKGAGAGLAANIKPGMRAVAVRVNDVNGIAGFVIPGMHVDVLISGTPPANPNPTAGAVAKTLLQDIEILSAGQNIQKDAEGKPVVVNLANLLVTPEQAEILNLASNDTRVQLVLRNPIDHATLATKGAWLQELYSGTTKTPTPKPPLAKNNPPPAAVAPPKPAERPFTIDVINGTHRSQAVFESINTAESAHALTMAPDFLHSGTKGTPYLTNLKVNGGTAPYVWSITRGTLPTGLRLDGGDIKGTPTSEPLTFKFTVTVKDNLGDSISKDFSIDIIP